MSFYVRELRVAMFYLHRTRLNALALYFGKIFFGRRLIVLERFFAGRALEELFRFLLDVFLFCPIASWIYTYSFWHVVPLTCITANVFWIPSTSVFEKPLMVFRLRQSFQIRRLLQKLTTEEVSSLFLN